MRPRYALCSMQYGTWNVTCQWDRTGCDVKHVHLALLFTITILLVSLLCVCQCSKKTSVKIPIAHLLIHTCYTSPMHAIKHLILGPSENFSSTLLNAHVMVIVLHACHYVLVQLILSFSCFEANIPISWKENVS